MKTKQAGPAHVCHLDLGARRFFKLGTLLFSYFTIIVGTFVKNWAQNQHIF